MEPLAPALAQWRVATALATDTVEQKRVFHRKGGCRKAPMRARGCFIGGAVHLTAVEASGTSSLLVTVCTSGCGRARTRTPILAARSLRAGTRAVGATTATTSSAALDPSPTCRATPFSGTQVTVPRWSLATGKVSSLVAQARVSASRTEAGVCPSAVSPSFVLARPSESPCVSRQLVVAPPRATGVSWRTGTREGFLAVKRQTGTNDGVRPQELSSRQRATASGVGRRATYARSVSVTSLTSQTRQPSSEVDTMQKQEATSQSSSQART